MKLPIKENNPVWVARELGQRLRRLRLEQGWGQEELAARAGIGLSSLKKLESSGKGTLDRMLQVAATLGVIGDCARLFEERREVESLQALQSGRRKRAPRRRKGGDS